MSSIALLGASGHGKVAAEIAEQIGFSTIHFFDAIWPERVKIGKWPVLGDERCFEASLKQYDEVFISIGDAKIREEKFSRLDNFSIKPTSLISPFSIVSTSVRPGIGSLIVQGAIVNADTKIGSGAIINTGSCVDHDCEIQNFVHIAPGCVVSGNVILRERVWLGTGSTVIQNIEIGSDTFVGAGSNVIRNLPENAMAYGNPATIRA